jgi:copper transport protein
MLETLATILRGLTYAVALSGAGMVLAGQTLGLRPPRWVRGLGGSLVLVTVLMAGLFLYRLGVTAANGEALAILASPLGLALVLQACGGLLLAIGRGRIAELGGAVAILLAFGVVGHAPTEGPWGSAAVLLHVTAAAWWLGGLLILLGQDSGMDPCRYADTVQRFGRQAIWVVAGLIVGAIVTAGILLKLEPDLARTYDRGLLGKAVLTLLLLGLAAANRLLLTPHLAASPRHRRWIRRSIGAELVLFLGVFAVTAWLTTTQSPHSPADEARAQADPPQGNSQMQVTNAWAPALPGSSGTGAAYMTLTNLQQQDDRLIAATSPWSEAVTLHRTVTDGRMTGMADIDDLLVPAGGEVTLEPGVYHLMFTGLYAPFVAGDLIPMTLTFERAGPVDILLTVRSLDEATEALHRH